MDQATPTSRRDSLRDVDLSAEQVSLRAVFRKYLDVHIEPLISGSETSGTFPSEVLPGLASFGLVGGCIPESIGGHGLTYLDLAILMEETGYSWTSLRSTLNTLNMVSHVLALHGSDYQRERYLAPLLTGTKLAFFGQTEPDHGSDVRSMTTTALRDGTDYVITGTKLWITNGAVADFGLVLANVISNDAREPSGLTVFIVDPTLSRYESRRVQTMFLKATTTSELVFSETRVPVSHVVGTVGAGVSLFLAGLDVGRLNVAMGAVGVSQRALDMSTAYACSRVQFGKPIGRFQLIQALVSEIRMGTAAARALGYAAAKVLDAGGAHRADCAVAKLFATETAYASVDKAMQIHGAMGTSVELGLERMFRDARGGLIVEGTSQIQRLVIARDQLGVAAFV